MKKSEKLILYLLAFVFVLIGASILYSRLKGSVEQEIVVKKEDAQAEGSTDTETSNEESTEEKEDTKLPDFTVADADGKEVHLSDFEGKPVILNFWASWCGPCKSEMPDFQEMYEIYGEDIHFVIVNMTDGSRETLDSAKEFVESQGYTFPVYYDIKLSAAIAYSVSTIPATYFIDAQRNAVAMANGMLSMENLQKGIDMLLES